MERDLRIEQEYLDACYALLASLGESLDHRIEAIVHAPSTGTGQDLLEREALVNVLLQQRRAARAAASRLCFGRIDTDAGAVHHIGRIGLRTQDGEPVLLDWRAPNAAPFYQATQAQPLGIQRRRRIITRDRTVTHVEDEDFGSRVHGDGANGGAFDGSLGEGSLGEGSRPEASASAARAVEEPREGRMGNIVATIAADQDAIIRSPLAQLTVVEGGPGTGKTVVALHRAAWLLYTHRERLARDGVLIIGPSPTFLHYIEQVLPSLGETDVVLVTPGQLYPGIDARELDSPQVAAIKGDLRMARVVAAAVRGRIRIPDRDVTIDLEDGSRVTVTARQLGQARAAVPRQASFHAGREPFLTRVLDQLAADRARQLREDPSDPDVRRAHAADLADDVNVRRTLNLMWLPITPEQLVGRLLSDPSIMAQAAEGVLTAAEQARLLRDPAAPWTVDDVPLIDEAAERLGPWDRHAARRAAAERAERARELAHARQALADTGMGGWIDAAGLVDRMASGALGSTVAERAEADRTWVYGHIVVDEAQELSRMAWLVLARRATRKSMTVVGDLQQASHPAGARTWQAALAPVRGSIDVHALTVTYRITRQIADEAVRLLVAAGGQAPDLTPVRDGEPVIRARCARADLAAHVRHAWRTHSGRAAVIVPDDDPMNVIGMLCSDSDDFGSGDLALDAPIAVLTARQTKGLEFDHVFLIDPDQISAQTPHGADIYVAATRATRQLHLITLEP